MHAAIVIAQAVFVYFLLWWVAFPSLLAVDIPDFEIRRPSRAGGHWHMVRVVKFTHRVGKKAVLACGMALIAWIVVFPLVKSDWLSFRHFSDELAVRMQQEQP